MKRSRSLSKKKIKEIMEKLDRAEREQRQLLLKADLPEIVQTGKKCSACKNGNVVKEKSYDATPLGPYDMIGPGGGRALIEEYYCNSCGVMYKFPPKK